MPAVTIDPATAQKMYQELTKLYEKTMNNPGMVYALKASVDGFYNVYSSGSTSPTSKVYLKAGEVWKYGETTNPAERYSPSCLAREKVYLDPIARVTNCK